MNWLLRPGLIEVVVFVCSIAMALALRWRPEDAFWAIWATSVVAPFLNVLIDVFSAVGRSGRDIRLSPDEDPGPLGGVMLCGLLFFFYGFVGSVLGDAFGFMPDVWKSHEIASLHTFFPPVRFIVAGYWPFIALNLFPRVGNPWGCGADFMKRARYIAVLTDMVMISALVFVIFGLVAVGMRHLATVAILVIYGFPWRMAWHWVKGKVSKVAST